MIDLKIGLHQINTITGDIKGNLEKIKIQILNDQKKNADLSIFPETAITGYMCGSLWDRSDFVKEQQRSIYDLEEFIQDINYKGTVVIGFVDVIGKKGNGFPHLKNAAAIINLAGTNFYHKQLLASSDHHEDKKYFDRGEGNKAFTVKLPSVGKITLGVLICEDAWINDHKRNIPKELVNDFGIDLLVHINQSYFYYGKQEKRVNQFSHIAKSCNIPVISVNSVGIGDILKNLVIFDGGSTIFDNRGNMRYEASRFKEVNEVIETGQQQTKLPKFPSKYEEISQALMYEQKEFFKLCGIPKAQVHISGGLDSSIVAALVSKAMGPENCVFITNPSNLNKKSLVYVEHIRQKFGQVWVNPIQEIYDKFMTIHNFSFDSQLSDTGKASVQATLRTVQGLAASHQFGSGIVATGNHTEIVLGWASFHDIGSIGVHALIGDLTKVELFQLSEYINKELYNDEVIPNELFNGKFKPAAELPDAMEDPIDYWVQSGICALLIRERKDKDYIKWIHELISMDCVLPPDPDIKDYFPKLDEVKKYSKSEWDEQVNFALNKMKISVYKAAQAAPIVIISPRSRGFSNRETLINKYEV